MLTHKYSGTPLDFLKKSVIVSTSNPGGNIRREHEKVRKRDFSYDINKLNLPVWSSTHPLKCVRLASPIANYYRQCLLIPISVVSGGLTLG